MSVATAADPDVAVHADELHKAFGVIRAVDGISIELPAGKTTGLLGPNGAGKTTLVHLLTGALAPDRGRVELPGRGSPRRAGVRQAFGVAPQAVALYEDLTGAENLRLYGRLYGLRRQRLRERIGWCLDFAGLADRAGDRVGGYSGGMQRRLNLACALVHDPEILFLDEPTVGVDPQSRSHIFGRIEELQRQGRTILYTTHDMEGAQRLCDRVAIVDRGRILDEDTVPALLRRHGGGAVVEVDLVTPPANPASLPGTLTGTTLRARDARPLEVLRELERASLDFRSLRIEEPDLETVFLALTGRALRD